MNRLLLGVLLGIAFGLIDVAMAVFGNQPNHTFSMLWPAFFSRFAIGFLVANVNLRLPILAGALVGLLLRLPDAFALKAFPGILGSDLMFGAITWGSLNPRGVDHCEAPDFRKGHPTPAKKDDHVL